MSRLQIEYENFIRSGVRELKNSEEKLKERFSDQLEYSSLFLMPFHQSDPESVSSVEKLIRELSSAITFQRETAESGIFSSCRNFEAISLHYLIFKNIDPAIVKDILLDQIQKLSGRKHRSIRYNRYGLFIPRTGRVICYSFAHSGSMYYRYRLAEFKLKNLPSGLSSYLLSLVSYCPDEYFFSGSRASGFILPIKPSIEHTDNHILSSFTTSALKIGKFKNGHENVEKYLLECDPETIACEVPVWYEKPRNSELRIEGVLTGHIDILRYERNGKIGIWDYKPRARYEKKAHMQVYLYALMLSQRSGIPLSDFLCGYFDSKDAYFFNAPSLG